jgi:hypothetical protein
MTAPIPWGKQIYHNAPGAMRWGRFLQNRLTPNRRSALPLHRPGVSGFLFCSGLAGNFMLSKNYEPVMNSAG